MKKRYQKAPRISHWNTNPANTRNLIKVMECITGEPIPNDLKKIMIEIANTKQ